MHGELASKLSSVGNQDSLFQSNVGVDIKLGSRNLNSFSEPYIIAEVGVNHEGSLKKALKLVELAAEGGADAVKFQTYKAEALAARDSPAYWDLSKEPTLTQYELFQKYDSFGPSDYEIIAAHCREIGIDFASTPFDDASVDFLDPLVSYFKVASADITNIPLISRIASKRKPVVISTGASTKDEIKLALDVLREGGVKDVCIMHCILSYPTEDSHANLRMIEDLRKSFPKELIGYSDHTELKNPLGAVQVAYVLGATVIEKHFTDDKSQAGNDHYHSADVSDLRALRDWFLLAQTFMGTETEKAPIAVEESARLYARRSLVAAKNLKQGHELSAGDLVPKRPGTGISPTQLGELLGKKLAINLKEDELVLRSHIEGEWQSDS